MSLAGLSARNARLYPGKPAFVMGDRVVTFAEHHRRAQALAADLAARGLRPGARIAVLARNCLEYLDIYAAAETYGYVVAPLNFRLTAAELAGIVEGLDPHVLFFGAAFADVAPDAPLRLSIEAPPRDQAPSRGIAPADDDVVYLMSTSGTTGRPRAAMLTRRGQWLDALALALEQRLAPEDRHLATMPLYHVGGRALVLSHTLRGCTVHLHDAFDADAVTADIERHRITTTQVVPTMVSWLLDAPARDLSSLRLVWYASAPMPVELLRRALTRFGPIFVQGYGQTETGPLATVLAAADHDPESERLGSAGRAIPGVDVRIEDGEILVRSPLNMTGYWRQDELTAEAFSDGWLRTGDLGRMDDLGYVYVVDRKTDLIISGGENIYPRKVEEVLYAHPAVREAAVIGVPDALWGEAVRAFVVPAGELAEGELIAFCRTRLARYKCPKSVELRAELPKSPSGKVLKRELRA
jgi:O-succinylbenzoate-CoA ligase